MQLRDHPIFLALGGYNFRWWPPTWSRVGHGRPVYGEVGLLVDVKINERLPERLSLTMEHEGGLYMGTLVVNDAALCIQLRDLLQKSMGRTIKEVGDLKIDFLL